MPLPKAIYYGLLKIGIAVMCGIFLYKRTLRFDYLEIETLYKHCFVTNWWLLLLAILLLFFNWGIETIKWKYLIRKIEKLTFFKAFGAIMAGVTISSFTPNRVGEFGGRMMLLTNKFDTRVITLTIIGGMSQLMVTLGIGIPCLVFFLTFYNVSDFEHSGWILGFGTVGLLIYAVVFCKLPFIYRQINLRFGKHNLLKRITEGVAYIDGFGLRYITMLSLMRYLIFFSQYVLVLLFFNVHLLWYHYLLFLPAVFLIQTIIPTFVLTEIGVRASVAIAVLSVANHGEDQIMAASALLWIINLMLPAMVGVVILLFTRLTKSER